MSITDMRFAAPAPRSTAGTMLVGRDGERTRLEQELRTRQSTVLVVRGGRGIGKTALLDFATDRARDHVVIRARAVESETGFPYAGLQLLCAPLLDRLGRLQPHHRDALSTAVGASSGPRPDPFLVGLATLSLLSQAAATRPLLCIVDDAQWLDRPSAEVLAFVARRLDGQPVMLLLARQDTPPAGALDTLPELRLEGLSPTDARALLGRVLPGRADRAVVERIVGEARGNPLALLELGPGMSPAELAGGFGVPGTAQHAGPEADTFLEQVRALPGDSRRLLLAAAAEPTGDPPLLWRAAAHLDVPPEAAFALDGGDLLEFGPRISFRRPSLRAVVYGLATNEERRCVHRALAAATDPATDPVRRAWHLASGTGKPDEPLAQELEHRAAGARALGGLAAAAAFLEKATLLSPEPRRRAGRALAAAAAEHEAGADGAAERLLHTAELGPLDAEGRLRLQRQRAQVASATSQADDVAERLLRSARQLEPLDLRLARETYLEALGAAISAGRMGLERGAVDVAKVAAAGPAAAAPRRAIDDLLDALVVRHTEGPAAAAEPVRRALEAFGRSDGDPTTARWRRLASVIAADVWDDETWHSQTSLDVQGARESGALAVLPTALDNRALAELHAGDLTAAARLAEEATDLGARTGTLAVPQAALLLAAWRGREVEASPLFERARRHAFDRGEGRTLTAVGLAAAVLFGGLGRHAEALECARDATETDDVGLLGWSLAELVEAAVRAREPDAAALALHRLAERTGSSGTDWALGIEARCRAMTTDGPSADDHFRESVIRLGRTRIRSELARTRLVYGEWLRREGRRVDARAQLHAASESFTTMGASAFAQRAQRELLATGEKVRSGSGGGQLTPQEAHVASLAADGLSNPAIAARMYVSPRTVEYHLHKVFSKLGITSRGQLSVVLPAAAGPAGPLPRQREAT